MAVVTRAQQSYELLSEWDIDSALTPAAIAERRHPFIAITHKVPLLLPSAQKAEMKADPASHIAKLEELKGQKQMLMYGHVDLPTENFSFKWESGAPQCEDGCAFQDKVFTVEGFDKLCLTHCGEIDGMLKDASKGQRKSIELAQKVVRQQLAALKVDHGSNSLFKPSQPSSATAATHPLLAASSRGRPIEAEAVLVRQAMMQKQRGAIGMPRGQMLDIDFVPIAFDVSGEYPSFGTDDGASSEFSGTSFNAADADGTSWRQYVPIAVWSDQDWFDDAGNYMGRSGGPDTRKTTVTRR